MNILEVHIEEVHSVKELRFDKWHEEHWVEVDATTDCYGRKSRGKHSFPRPYWEKVQARGYWLA